MIRCVSYRLGFYNYDSIMSKFFRMRKARLESTAFREVRVEEGLAKLKQNVSWE